jgi:hypothetical protein
MMSEMTSPEFCDAARTIEIALVPVGATEQHGPTRPAAYLGHRNIEERREHALRQIIGRAPNSFVVAREFDCDYGVTPLVIARHGALAVRKNSLL